MTTGYDTDFSMWAKEQAQRIRSRQWHLLDVDNLAEEVDAIARSEYRELRSTVTMLLRCELLAMHLNADQAQAYEGEISFLRLQANAILEDSPSQRDKFESMLPSLYAFVANQVHDQLQSVISVDELFSIMRDWSLEKVLKGDIPVPGEFNAVK